MRLRKWVLGLMILGLAVLGITGCDDNSTSSDTQNPVIELTYPVDNAEFIKGEIITITAEATDNETVRNVEFYIHNLMVSFDEEAPYTYEFDTSGYSSDVQISVMAYDVSDNTASTETITITIIDMEFNFPLTIGNSWQYDRIYSTYYDSLAHFNGHTDDVFNSVGSIEIMGSEVLFDNIEVYDFASSLSEEGGQPMLSNSYYNSEDNSLICYGYTNGSIIGPKRNNEKVYYNFDNKKFNTPQEMVAYVESGYVRNSHSRDDYLHYDPVKCYVYPMNENQEWVYRTSNNPWKIVKTVIGMEEVDVAAGDFNCWKIQITHPQSDWNNDIDFYEYVSREGVIKRVLEIRNATITDEDGNYAGSWSSISEQYLTDYQVTE